MIKIENLTKDYKTKKALDAVSMVFEDNKIYAILGRNGAGKTTLINIITNRAFGTEGNVTVDGVAACENDSVQGKIFCITERSEYPTSMKVNAAFKWAKGFYPSFDEKYAAELSVKFELDITKKFKQLSTGYRTIAKVVLTMASNAPIMILDEPVLGIDSIYRNVFYDELRKVHAKNKNIIVIATHLIDEVAEFLDNIIILKTGKVIYDGTVKQLASGKKSLNDVYVGLHTGGGNE